LPLKELGLFEIPSSSVFVNGLGNSCRRVHNCGRVEMNEWYLEHSRIEAYRMAVFLDIC
jgi:hypothetical protein